MAVLVLVEHDNQGLRAATLNTVAAATQIGGELHLLVAGSGVGPVAQAAAQIAGVSKVLVADAPQLAQFLPEQVADVVRALAPAYSHVLAAATSNGKNILPRAAALCDMQQISEIVAVVSPDSFVRPIYAGNALATVQSADAIKFAGRFQSIQATSSEAASKTGNDATALRMLATENLFSMVESYRFYQRKRKRSAEHRTKTRLKFRF